MNGYLMPYQVTPGSGKKVWWRCSRGHEWEASPNNRTKGRGCPYCAGKKASKECNLAVKHPELTKEWHPTRNGDLTPDQVTPSSGKKVWWRCSQGHECEASPDGRAGGTGCPDCYNEKRGEILRKAALQLVGSLADRNPELAREWHPTKNGTLKP